MGESFLIKINCSKILPDSDETHYTMLIDTTKMSIVYELVEWIRWMFSLENCVYITHGNSVIHELEDIQLLSRLGNFEIKPCGRYSCVHKKTYRILLKNLGLFVHWNNTEVHKYFLHKLNQVDKKLTQECCKASPAVFSSDTKDFQSFITNKSTEMGNTKMISPEIHKCLCENKVPEGTADNMPPNKKRALSGKLDTEQGTNVESPSDINSCAGKNVVSNENFLTNFEDKFCCLKGLNSEVTENLTPEMRKSMKSPVINNTLVQSKLQTAQILSKSNVKPCSKKYVKPFSVGEILLNIREDLKNQSKEMTLENNSPSQSSLMLKEGDSDAKTSGENLFLTGDKTSGMKKRNRIRRRKKIKKENSEEHFSSFVDKTTNEHSWDFKLSAGLKPSHIRFYTGNEDNLMEIECVEDKLSENKFGINNSDEFLQNEPKEMRTEVNNSGSDLSEPLYVSSGIINASNKMECSPAVDNQFTASEKFIDMNNQDCNISESYSGTENFESKNLNQSSNILLSLKEKFKSAVVIERFY